MKAFKKIIQTAVIGVSSLAAFGCGSSGSSNDQGTSFTLYNFYQDNICTVQVNGAVGPLGIDRETEAGTASTVYAAMQNNMLSQGIRVTRASYTFFVEGAKVQPPATTAPTGIVLAAAGKTNGTSLPGSLSGDTPVGSPSNNPVSNVGCLGVNIIPSDIKSYLSLNRNNLPELPFTMRVELTLNGITTSGNNINSNPLDFFVEFTSDNIISAGGGTSSSASSTAATSTDNTLDTTEDSGTDGSLTTGDSTSGQL